MVTAAQIQFLAEHGWPVGSAPFDLCWLDCSDSGWLKTWRDKPGGTPLCICLCPYHAVLLEQGVWAGDYTGAPLPPESTAAEWPWQPCSEVATEAVRVPG